jgi:hypothetical protein
VKAELENELGWLEREPHVEMEFGQRPVLVADRIVGGDDNVALVVETTSPKSETASSKTGTAGMPGEPSTAGHDKPVGTSGRMSAWSKTALTDAAALGRGSDELIGRRVDLDDVAVARLGAKHGFWVNSGGRRVFVLPASADARVAAGRSVSIQGMVLEMPRSMRNKNRTADANSDIYVYATTVK